MKLTYQNLRSSESVGRDGALGVCITVGGDLPNLDHESIRHASYKAEEMVRNAIIEVKLAADPKAQEDATRSKEKLLALFPSSIFVETIPNGYSPNDPYTKHLPWFTVTTVVGRITLGWRRSVINIDWSQTVGTKKAEELFPTENVTKGDRYIHAWGYEDAKRYITAIMASAAT